MFRSCRSYVLLTWNSSFASTRNYSSKTITFWTVFPYSLTINAAYFENLAWPFLWGLMYLFCWIILLVSTRIVLQGIPQTTSVRISFQLVWFWVENRYFSDVSWFIYHWLRTFTILFCLNQPDFLNLIWWIIFLNDRFINDHWAFHLFHQ